MMPAPDLHSATEGLTAPYCPPSRAGVSPCARQTGGGGERRRPDFGEQI